MEIETQDIALAAALATVFPILRVEKVDDGRKDLRMKFVFESSPDTKLYVEKFYRQECRVEPQEYALKIRMIKHHIFSDK
jgi:hypothetical protein